MTALDARFDNGARLLGYEIRRDHDEIGVDLFWDSAGPIADDWAVFVDALADGERIPQEEQDPVVRAIPWALNEIVTTHHTLDVSGFDPDAISIAVSLYAFDTIKRTADILQGVLHPENWIRREAPVIIPPPA